MKSEEIDGKQKAKEALSRIHSKERYHLVDMNSIYDDAQELHITEYTRENVQKIVDKLNDYHRRVQSHVKYYMEDCENIKKHEPTKHYLTIQLENGLAIENSKNGFLIREPFNIKVIDHTTLRLIKKRGGMKNAN